MPCGQGSFKAHRSSDDDDGQRMSNVQQGMSKEETQLSGFVKVQVQYRDRDRNRYRNRGPHDISLTDFDPDPDSDFDLD